MTFFISCSLCKYWHTVRVGKVLLIRVTEVKSYMLSAKILKEIEIDSKNANASFALLLNLLLKRKRCNKSKFVK